MSLEIENTITPTQKSIEINEIKENELYSCTECSSNIEILALDDKNNILSFKCPSHGSKSMTIQNYLKDMKKNTLFYSKCNLCDKKQNEINNNETFNYCTNCQLIICNNCIFKHDKSHFKIKNNQRFIRCSLHPKNNNISYCIDCNCHLCKECLKHRKHMRHNKQTIEEIEPSYDEINSLLKIINKYKDEKNISEINKNNELIEIDNKFNEDKEKENDEYNKLILNTKKELEYELTDNERKYNYEINEIKIKYDKEIKVRKDLFNETNIKINDKYKKINDNNKNNYNKKLDILERKYKNEKIKIENKFKQEINHINELLNINDIIYNTYNKNKENYFYNINIINLLINYYEKGNKIIKEMKDNEDFMETIKQKEYEMIKSPKDENINLNLDNIENNIKLEVKNEEKKRKY